MHDAAAYEEATMLHLGQTALEELLVSHPVFSRALLRLDAQRLDFPLMAIETYSAQSMEQRLANRLLMLSASFGPDVGAPLSLKINLHLPQEVLAGLIVTTRRRVGQILNDWQNQKLVAHGYGHIPLRVALVLVGLALSMGRR